MDSKSKANSNFLDIIGRKIGGVVHDSISSKGRCSSLPKKLFAQDTLPHHYKPVLNKTEKSNKMTTKQMISPY